MARLLALDHLERQTCTCGCGLPVIEAHDKSVPMATEPVVCYARRALTIAQRDAAQLALPEPQRDKKWRKGNPQPGDGVLWTVYPYKPETTEVHDD